MAAFLRRMAGYLRPYAGQCALNALIGRNPISASRTTVVSAQVRGEEPQRAVQLEHRDLGVLAGVGVQRLLGGAESVEEVVRPSSYSASHRH